MTDKLKINVVPTSGEQRQVEVDATTTPLREVLKKAKLNPKGFQVSVNGEPADLDAAVPDGATVTLTEKVKGS